jgi:hypothetical protein
VQSIDHPTRDLETREKFGTGEMPASATLTIRKSRDAPDRGCSVGRKRRPTHLIRKPSRCRAVHGVRSHEVGHGQTWGGLGEEEALVGVAPDGEDGSG